MIDYQQLAKAELEDAALEHDVDRLNSLAAEFPGLQNSHALDAALSIRYEFYDDDGDGDHHRQRNNETIETLLNNNQVVYLSPESMMWILAHNDIEMLEVLHAFNIDIPEDVHPHLLRITRAADGALRTGIYDHYANVIRTAYPHDSAAMLQRRFDDHLLYARRRRHSIPVRGMRRGYFSTSENSVAPLLLYVPSETEPGGWRLTM